MRANMGFEFDEDLILFSLLVAHRQCSLDDADSLVRLQNSYTPPKELLFGKIGT